MLHDLNMDIMSYEIVNLEGCGTFRSHTGKCIRRFAGIYAYCRYFIDRKWSILV